MPLSSRNHFINATELRGTSRIVVEYIMVRWALDGFAFQHVKFVHVLEPPTHTACVQPHCFSTQTITQSPNLYHLPHTMLRRGRKITFVVKEHLWWDCTYCFFHHATKLGEKNKSPVSGWLHGCLSVSYFAVSGTWGRESFLEKTAESPKEQK